MVSLPIDCSGFIIAAPIHLLTFHDGSLYGPGARDFHHRRNGRHDPHRPHQYGHPMQQGSSHHFGAPPVLYFHLPDGSLAPWRPPSNDSAPSFRSSPPHRNHSFSDEQRWNDRSSSDNPGRRRHHSDSNRFQHLWDERPDHQSQHERSSPRSNEPASLYRRPIPSNEPAASSNSPVSNEPASSNRLKVASKERVAPQPNEPASSNRLRLVRWLR
jgi:hypothetical protein